MSKCVDRDLYLGYNMDDDGVHALCHNCKFDKNIGWNAWILELQHAIADHFTECEYESE